MPLKKEKKKKNTKISENKNRLQKEIELIIKKAEEQNKALAKIMEANKSNNNKN